MTVIDLDMVRLGTPTLREGRSDRPPYVRLPVTYRTEDGEREAVLTLSFGFARMLVTDLWVLLHPRRMRR